MHSTTLHNAQQASEVLRKLYEWAKPRLMAGHKLRLSVEEEKRNLSQNALLHATIADIAARREHWGKKWDAEVWKRLLVAAWCRANGEAIQMVPALDGSGIDIVFRRTSDLTKAECADLITWIQAWDATQP